MLERVVEQLRRDPLPALIRRDHEADNRADRRVRFDSRNRILVHLKCHARFKVGTIRVVRDTAQTFTIDGRIYLDADQPLTFTEHPEG